MADLKPIAPSNLRVDQQNPRLSDPRPTSQSATLEAMARWDERMLLGLAKHIAARGLDPSNLPIVIQEEPGSRFYIVLEGNRRLTAVKALENPALVAKAISPAVLSGLKTASAEYAGRPISEINCLVVGSREEARPWIEVRHQGEQGGAGLIRWLSVEGARYAEQFGGKKSYGLRVLEFLDKLGALDNETEKAIKAGFALSTLERLLSNEDVREVVGIDKTKGDWTAHFPDTEVAKPLKKMVGDIALKRIKVSDVDNNKLMAAYLKKFKTSDRPDSKSRQPQPHVLGTDKTPVKLKPKNKGRRGKRSHDRVTLIPREYHVIISHQRCNDIFIELKELRVSDFRNSVAVLSRVFLELSLDIYIKKHRIWPTEQLRASSLGQKMNAVAQRLRKDGKFDDQQLRAIQRAARDDSRLAPTVTTLHQYIHNEHMVPMVSDLNAEWQILEPLISALWS
jgi:hypothetical protein